MAAVMLRGGCVRFYEKKKGGRQATPMNLGGSQDVGKNHYRRAVAGRVEVAAVSSEKMAFTAL